MSTSDEQLARLCLRAIETSATELELEPDILARRLGQAEIARLVHLLNAAMPHVDHAGLRHRIEDVLLAVTDGRMPGETPETELDWALKVARRRREERDRSQGHDDSEPEP